MNIHAIIMTPVFIKRYRLFLLIPSFIEKGVTCSDAWRQRINKTMFNQILPL